MGETTEDVAENFEPKANKITFFADRKRISHEKIIEQMETLYATEICDNGD